MAWHTELGDLYTEAYPASVNRAPSIKGVPAAAETNRSLAWKGTFSEPEKGVMDQAMAMSAINPIPEQEEEPSSSMVLRLIEDELSQLDINNPQDKNTILVLSNLTSKIRKLK